MEREALAERLIVNLGVDVNGMVPGTGLDRSALHKAAGWGGVEMVKLLLELGADRYLRDPTYDAAPIGWALHNQQREVVEYLLPFATVFDAVRCDVVERVAELLQQNRSLSNATDEGGNPLAFYTHPEMNRLEEMLQVLTEYGVNLNARNGNGRTIVDRALAQGWTDFADILRRSGAGAAAE